MRKIFCAAILAGFAFFAFAPNAFAQSSGPSPFECPWTAVPADEPAPSSEGCYGGGEDAGCNPAGANGPAYPCTSDGTNEANQALSLLQSGMDVCAVADQLNATRPASYAASPGDTACVCYPSGPYVGCREFYMAGPDDGSFTPANYQSNASMWFIVSRCDSGCTDPNGCM